MVSHGSEFMFLVVEEEKSTCSRLNPPSLFSSKTRHAMLSHKNFQNVNIAFCLVCP